MFGQNQQERTRTNVDTHDAWSEPAAMTRGVTESQTSGQRLMRKAMGREQRVVEAYKVLRYTRA